MSKDKYKHKKFCIDCDKPADKTCVSCGSPICEHCCWLNKNRCYECYEDYEDDREIMD